MAIKVLPPDLTRDETAKQRFLQEAKAASALDHPNICTIHEINETDDGQLYLTFFRAGLPTSEAVNRAARSPSPVQNGATKAAEQQYEAVTELVVPPPSRWAEGRSQRRSVRDHDRGLVDDREPVLGGRENRPDP